MDREFRLAGIDDPTPCQPTTNLNTSVDISPKQPAKPSIQFDNCPQILPTAKTGKVANILGQLSGVSGYTLDAVKNSFYQHHTKQINCSTDEIHEPWRFSKVKVLIVDECSQVPVHLFATVLSMLLKEAELRKIVLFGDTKYLPSIDPGEN